MFKNSGNWMAVALLLLLAGTAHAQLTDTACGGAIAANGEAEGVCSIASVEFWANGSGPCDFGLKTSKFFIDALTGSGVCINDTRNTQPYAGSWVQWALAQQRVIGKDLPYNLLPRIGTHKSFSNMADSNSNGLNTNQQFSITDQLNMGVRSIELDPHFYFGQVRLCQASSNAECLALAGSQYLLLANSFLPDIVPINLLPPPIPDIIDPVAALSSVGGGASNNRLFVSAIREINDWLTAHPSEFVQLNLTTDSDNFLEGEIQKMMQAMLKYLALERLYTATELQNDLNSLKRFATLAELLGRGRQMMVNSDLPETLLGDPTNTVYTVSNQVANHNVAVPTIRPLGGTGATNPDFSACNVTWTDSNNVSHHDTVPSYIQKNPLTGVRTDESRTGNDFLSGFTGLLDEAQVEGVTKCGYTEIYLDFLGNRSNAFGAYANPNPDLRREASIWSWKEGQQPTTNVAAMEVQQLDASQHPLIGYDGTPTIGRWVSAPYFPTGTSTYWYACVENGAASTATYPREWHLVKPVLDWYDGLPQCALKGWVFDYPRNALDNRALQTVAVAAGAQLVYLNYSPGTIQPAATVGITNVYMDQGGAPPDPVPTEVDGYRNLFFYPSNTGTDPFYLLNLGNIGSPSAPIPLSAGPVNILTGILPDAASLPAQGSGYTSTFNVNLYQETNGSYGSYPYPGNYNPATGTTAPPVPANGGISLFVMLPTTTTVNLVSNGNGTYTAVTTVNPKCGGTSSGNNDPSIPTGTVYLKDTYNQPGAPPATLDLGWILINNNQDAGSPLGTGQLPVVNCSPYLTLTANSGCGTLTLPVGHHSIVATYTRDSGYNTSASIPLTIDIGGGMSPSTLMYSFAPTATLNASQTLTWNQAALTVQQASTTYSWIKVTGLNPFTVTVTPPAYLLPGIYTDTLNISGIRGLGNPTINLPPVPIQINIAGSMSVDRPSLTFTNQDQTMPLTTTSATTQYVNVSYEGGPIVATAAGAPWLTVQATPNPIPGRGGSVAVVTITPNPAGLGSGTYTATVLISQPGNPTTVPVTVTLTETITGTIPAISFTTTPPNLKFICDETTFTAPYTILDPKGGQHSCTGVTTIQNVAAGTRALFQQWSDGQPGVVRTFTATAGTPQSYTLTYRLQNEVTVTVDPVCSGTVSPIQSWYNPGTSSTTTATPASGFIFAGYSGDFSDKNVTHTVASVNNPMNVTAHFVCSTNPCAALLAPLANSVVLNGGQSLVSYSLTSTGSPISFELSGGLPSWLTVTASQLTTPANIVIQLVNNSLPTKRGQYFANIALHPSNGTTDGSLSVELDMESIKIVTDPVGAMITVDNQNYTDLNNAPPTFVWQSGSQHALGIPAQPAPAQQYVFNSWSDHTPASHVIVGPQYGNQSELTAKFDTYYQVTSSSAPVAGGSVVIGGTAQGAYYLTNSKITATATPAANYAFSGFTGTVRSMNNPVSISVSGALNVIANFVPACDVNASGGTTVADVQSILNQALGGASPTKDLNRDGVVNLVDVQIVINAAMGLNCLTQ
jgi:hypothetical protein